MCSDVTDATFGVDRTFGTRKTSNAPSTVTVLFLILQEENAETSFILDKILNFIDWIVTFCGGKYMETFHELRTEIEIQKIGFMLDI